MYFTKILPRAGDDDESGDFESSEVVKREAVGFIARKPLHLRKKFYYVLQ